MNANMTGWVANTYAATCACGWAGVVRLAQAQASQDLITHRKTTHSTKESTK